LLGGEPTDLVELYLRSLSDAAERLGATDRSEERVVDGVGWVSASAASFR
jgi:hypothetical protein